MLLIDTHCHLAAEQFAADRGEVAAAALAAGIGMLAAAVDKASSALNLRLAAAIPGVLASIGVHPTETADLDEAAWRGIAELAASPLAAAIGETGLDYHWKNVPVKVQEKWFERHIELALATGKPLLLHARSSVSDALARLEPHFAAGLTAVWHCFSAGKREIGPALEFAAAHGVRMAVGGMATFEDQKPLRAAIPMIPDHLLLLETDAPYLSPRPKASDRNEPIRLLRIAETVAELRGRSFREIAELTARNAEKLFPGFREGYCPPPGK
ncbi:MAG: TatD family hydrolase [Planctomycetota bacterium]|jgi:TatD DNase family protein|nr:TatD family hydrolase [Planctomycetota bacterium]